MDKLMWKLNLRQNINIIMLNKSSPNKETSLQRNLVISSLTQRNHHSTISSIKRKTLITFFINQISWSFMFLSTSLLMEPSLTSLKTMAKHSWALEKGQAVSLLVLKPMESILCGPLTKQTPLMMQSNLERTFMEYNLTMPIELQINNL